MFKNVLTIWVAIATYGALSNFLIKGNAGATIQKGAQFVADGWN